MKNFFKNYFKSLGVRSFINWGIFFILLIALFRTCTREMEASRLIEDSKRVKPNPVTEVTIEAKEIERKVDTSGRTKVIYELSDPIIKKIEDHSKIDSISRVAEIKESKIKSLTTIHADLRAENLQLRRIVSDIANGKDTSTEVYQFKNRWITNTVYVKDSTVSSDIWLDATVNKVDYSHKKYWFFGRDSNRSKVWFENPYIKPNGLDYLEVKQNEAFWGIGIDIEGKYLHDLKEVIIGPKIDVKIGRFRINGGYYLNPGGNFGNTWWYGGGYKIY